MVKRGCGWWLTPCKPVQEGLKLDSSLASNARNLEMNLTRTDIPDAWNNKTVFLHMFAARNRVSPARFSLSSPLPTSRDSMYREAADVFRASEARNKLQK